MAARRGPPSEGLTFYFINPMADAAQRSVCWTPLWNPDCIGVGLEHLLLKEGEADSVVLAVDEKQGPFRLSYRLAWDAAWQLRDAELYLVTERATRSLRLGTDGQGHWHWADGQPLPDLEGCLDIDIWPTPFTNTFPIRREQLAIGERREFRMAWVFAPELTVQPQPQAYTRLADRLYLFESLEGSGFRVELPVDEQGIVLDYPELFRRVIPSG